MVRPWAGLFLLVLPANGFLRSPSVTSTSISSTRQLLLLASKGDNAEELSPRKTLQQEWKEKQNKILRNIASLEEACLQYSAEREEALRIQLRDSIENMLEKLLDSTSDKEVRLLVNQNFIETRQQIKQDLRQVRDREAAKLKHTKGEVTEIITELDTALSPAFMNYVGDESMEEVIAQMGKGIPGFDDAFRAIDHMAADEVLKNITSNPQKKQVQQAMDQFQSDMEDRLDDLSGDIRFQVLIAEERKE